MGFLSELNSRNVIQFYTIIVIQFLIEIFIIFQSSIFLWTISNYNKYEDPKLADQIDDYHEIDVMIAIRYVEPEILKKTLVGFNNTNYPTEKYDSFGECDQRMVYHQVMDKFNIIPFWTAESLEEVSETR